MKNKAKINYYVDIIIVIGFIISALSGIVLLLAGRGGFQGGRNPSFTENILLFPRNDWKSIHNVASIIMIAGVLWHLILHWNWIVCMTRNILKK